MAKTVVQLITGASSLRYTWALLLALGLTGSQAAAAQCRPAGAAGILDVNEVRAMVVNDGALFYRQELGNQRSLYVVPQSEGIIAPLFGGSMIVGGRVDGELRVAGSRYNRREFWPGPVQHLPADSLACDPYDRMFEINKGDVEALERRGVLTPNMVDWPWRWGAPVVDGDGDPTNYAPLDGDRPALQGDQMFWWVMNDAAGPHESTGSKPLGIEVRGSSFAFDTGGVLDYSTLHDLEIWPEHDVTDAYFGIWMDGDLGDFADDYLGSDSLLHLGYFYNADELDGDGTFGYGSPPPALGAVILKGPEASANGLDDDRDGETDEADEELGMSSFVCARKSLEAQNAEEYYNTLRGRLIDGTPERIGGGYWGVPQNPTLPETRFCFSGDPTVGEFWSAENMDDSGSALAPHDVRFQVNVGPFTLKAGEPTRVAFALLWTRGSDRLDSVTRLKAQARHVRQVRDALLSPTVFPGQPTPDGPEPPLSLAQTFPNPASDELVFQFSVPREAQVRLEIADLLGRTAEVVIEGRLESGPYRVPFDVSDLTPGVYFYRFHLDHRVFTRRMMVVR